MHKETYFIQTDVENKTMVNIVIPFGSFFSLLLTSPDSLPVWIHSSETKSQVYYTRMYYLFFQRQRIHFGNLSHLTEAKLGLEGNHYLSCTKSTVPILFY
jgi:hypothetical protein